MTLPMNSIQESVKSCFYPYEGRRIVKAKPQKCKGFGYKWADYTAD